MTRIPVGWALTRRRAERRAAALNLASLPDDYERQHFHVVEGRWLPRIVQYTEGIDEAKRAQNVGGEGQDG